MKKILLILTLFTATFSVKSWAQCTPDATLNHTGFSPANLPPAYADAPYNQTLSFHAVKDTSIDVNGNAFAVTIDSVILLSLNGFPAGFTYNCLNGCVVKGGGTGCALLSGNADSTQIGNYPIKTYVMTYYHGTLVPTFKGSRVDSSDSYTFRIYRTTGLADLFASNKNIAIKAYPNPASQQVSFDLSGLQANSQGKIVIYDAIGRETSQSTFVNNYVTPLNIEEFKPGIYKCKIVSDNQIYYTSFIKE